MPAGDEFKLKQRHILIADGRSEEDEADRQRPGGQGPDHDQPEARAMATGIGSWWRLLCNVSDVEIVADSAATVESVMAQRASHAKCERCWNYRPTVGQSAEHPTLCERCVRVLEVLQALSDG